jgi:hypothetical protein
VHYLHDGLHTDPKYNSTFYRVKFLLEAKKWMNVTYTIDIRQGYVQNSNHIRVKSETVSRGQWFWAKFLWFGHTQYAQFVKDTVSNLVSEIEEQFRKKRIFSGDKDAMEEEKKKMDEIYNQGYL